MSFRALYALPAVKGCNHGITACVATTDAVLRPDEGCTRQQALGKVLKQGLMCGCECLHLVTGLLGCIYKRRPADLAHLLSTLEVRSEGKC